MSSPRSWTTWSTSRRVAPYVATLPLLLALGLIIGLGTASREPSPTDALPSGSGSAAAAELAQRLPAKATSTAVVLWSAREGRLDQAQQDAIRDQASTVTAAQGGAGPSGAGAPADPVLSEDGTAMVLPVALAAGSATDTADAVTSLREQLRSSVPDGVSVAVTGPAAVQADLAAVFDGADITLLVATASVVALLLVLTYRSPVLWVVPLVVVGIADRLASVLATQAMHLSGVAWDESTTGILSVLVFGAGTDYALLLISRYRDELREHESRNAAMARALRRTSEAVLSSAVTVVVGVLTLLLSLTPTTRGLGLSSAVGIVVAVAVVMTALPAALVLFGRWVFWPRVPHVGSAASVETARVWGAVGRRVGRHPAPVAVLAGVVLLLGALPALGIRTGLAPQDQFLDTPEAISASQRLAESFPAGSSEPATVLSTAPGDEVLAAVRGSSAVASAQVTAEGDGVVQVDAVLDATPGTDAAGSAVDRLRTDLEALPDTWVGGSDAERIDDAAAAHRDQLLLLPLILALVVLALVVLLRSLVAPLVLVATVVATYAASLGLSWLLFTQVLSFEALDVGTPLLAFLFLVALGVDYNLFLVTRAREEASRHGTREGVLRALAATGGVITSAGILLAAVFATLGVLPLVVLAQLGVVIGVGVLLDTLVVRTVLVPALVVLLGDRFWWPRQAQVSSSAAAAST